MLLVLLAAFLFTGGAARGRTRRAGDVKRGWWPGSSPACRRWALGWFGGGEYEAIDSAVGTAFLGGLAGLLIGGIAYSIATRRYR